MVDFDDWEFAARRARDVAPGAASFWGGTGEISKALPRLAIVVFELWLKKALPGVSRRPWVMPDEAGPPFAPQIVMLPI